MAKRPSHVEAATIQFDREVVTYGSIIDGSDATTSSPPVTGSLDPAAASGVGAPPQAESAIAAQSSAPIFTALRFEIMAQPFNKIRVGSPRVGFN